MTNTNHKPDLSWDSPLIMMEGDAALASLPDALASQHEAAAADNLMLRVGLSIAVSLRRLADQLAPQELSEGSEEPAQSAEPAEPGAEDHLYPESYWAQGIRMTLLSFGDDTAPAEVAVDRVLSVLHRSLASDGFSMSHLGPSLPTKSSSGSMVRSPAPVPNYALRALMELASQSTPAEEDGLVHMLALAVNGLRSVLASNQRGWADGVHRAQAEYAMSLYRDRYPGASHTVGNNVP